MPEFVHGFMFTVCAVGDGHSVSFSIHSRGETEVEEEHVKGKQEGGQMGFHMFLCVHVHTHDLFSVCSQK